MHVRAPRLEPLPYLGGPGKRKTRDGAGRPATSGSVIGRCSATDTNDQPASKYELSSMSCTALACTRNERPTRTAGSSPLCTNRYTVILLTRIRLATSATVRN